MFNRTNSVVKLYSEKLNYIIHHCNYVENIDLYNQNAKNFYMALYGGSLDVNKPVFHVENWQILVL